MNLTPNAYDASSRASVTYTRVVDMTPPTFTARVTAPTTVVVTFSEDVDGQTALAEWTVAGAQPSMLAASGATFASDMLRIGSPVRTLTLTLAAGDALAADATPPVSYAKPTESGGNALSDAADNDLASTTGPNHVRATDGIASTAICLRDQ